MVRGLRPTLQLPPSREDTSVRFFPTRSEALRVEDLFVNRESLRVVPQGEAPSTSLIQPSDNQVHLTDLDFVKVIGKGSSGSVYLVRHKRTEQFFALKVIQVKMDINERQLSRELNINQLSHSPNVVVCYQSFYNNFSREISILLEYMDGGSLYDFLKKAKSIPEMYLSAISRQVLLGLVYLHHEQHVIHRDLKPSNILISHRGDVKITDFGVSVILENTACLQDTMIGTRVYMSPERISEQKYGYISDIWSFGLVMLECATGNFPYSAPDGKEGWDCPFDLLEAIVEHPAPAARQDVFSQELCSFISLCLQKEPKDRPSSRKLLEHPFLTKYNNRDIDLARYFKSTGEAISSILTDHLAYGFG